MIKGFYFITDSNLSLQGNIKDVLCAIKANVGIIQYRNKKLKNKKPIKELLSICEICKKYKVKFLVNDNIDIALKINADGVHLGQNDISCNIARKMLGKKKIIGITVRNVNQAIKAEQDKANYISIGPIFHTTTKKDAPKAKGISLIKTIKQECSIPIVAIGGINLKNAKSVIKNGANAICSISDVVTKQNITNQILKYQKLFEKCSM